jgi:hypothetical protein
VTQKVIDLAAEVFVRAALVVEIRRSFLLCSDLQGEFDAPMLAATTRLLLSAGTFDQDATHCLGRGGKEVAAAVPVLDLLGIDQPNVGIMHERRRLQGLSGLFACQSLRGQPA